MAIPSNPTVRNRRLTEALSEKDLPRILGELRCIWQQQSPGRPLSGDGSGVQIVAFAAGRAFVRTLRRFLPWQPRQLGQMVEVPVAGRRALTPRPAPQ